MIARGLAARRALLYTRGLPVRSVKAVRFLTFDNMTRNARHRSGTGETRFLTVIH